MGLFGSLFTGVSSLFAQSQNTAIISNNIANISTIGFKRSEASFGSLVTSESRLSRYSPGTVSVNRVQSINQQGSIQQTASATDGAISGNGFFPVKRSADFGQNSCTRALVNSLRILRVFFAMLPALFFTPGLLMLMVICQPTRVT